MEKYQIPNFKFQIKKGLPGGAKRSGGFTVLESIVAIFILSLSISGGFAAVQQSLSQATIAKDEVKAFYLAQEAIEIIRNKRDANQLARIDGSLNSWLYGISENVSDPCYFGTVCKVDASDIPPSITSCGASWDSCPYLNQSPSTFVYSYGPYPAANFKREVQIESVNANEISVTVRVSWSKGSINKEFKIKTHLFNWI